MTLPRRACSVVQAPPYIDGVAIGACRYLPISGMGSRQCQARGQLRRGEPRCPAWLGVEHLSHALAIHVFAVHAMTVGMTEWVWSGRQYRWDGVVCAEGW